jgi:peptide/nickel transport system substrate-binding protein
MEQGSTPTGIPNHIRRIFGLNRLESIFRSFSITEKAVFLVAAGLFAIGTLSVLHKLSDEFTVEIPARGGSLSEGIVGTPRFINPLLATSDADKDLTALVYSGLLKRTSAGALVPDLAASSSVSDDGLTYSFTIRPDAKFHDGKPLTADDVEFTVQKAQDSALKSPRQVSWEGVTVQKTGTHEISFILKKPYAPFMSSLTLGILPKHVWQAFQSDQFAFSSFNSNPIGSGPYKVSSVSRSDVGVPVSMSLRANRSYSLGEPYITNLSLNFYANDKALKEAILNGSVEGGSNLSPASAAELSTSVRIMEAPLTRIFGIFFNQNNKELLAHKAVRQALNLLIDKQEIIDKVLMGYGSVATDPLPPRTGTFLGDTASSTFSRDTDKAQALLAKDGWKMNLSTNILESKPAKAATTTLSFSLSTANVPELVDAAKHIEEDWSSAGIQADVKIFEPSDLNQTIIRPRKYEALLFGMVTGTDPDLYAFWHSSQRNDPGLNVSMYTNAKADKLLESMRQTADTAELSAQYKKFADEIATDSPAVFLWSPNFIYAIPNKVQGVKLRQITNPSDRFLDIETWYVDTDRIWEIFNRTK